LDGRNALSKQVVTDYRRIQITGRGSYIVSLPKKWVSDLSLSKGERIGVLRNSDGTLSLIPGEVTREEKTNEIEFHIRPDMDLNSVKRRIVSLYLVGYNTIKIRSDKDRISPVQRGELIDFVRKRLMGTEIVTESSNEILLQVLLSYPQLTIESALKRMATITDWMHRDAVKSIVERNTDLAEEVVKMDDEVDRFGFYIVRQLKTALRHPQTIEELGLRSPVDCLGYRLVTKGVERSADHAVLIARNHVKSQISKTILEKIQKTSDLASTTFNTALKSLYARDYRVADSLLCKSSDFEPLENEVIDNVVKSHLAPEDISSLRLIIESVRRIAEYGNDIAEVVLNLTVDVPDNSRS
jgi:phosphate uptake regulator